MIVKENFNRLLEILGFKQEENTYTKTINNQILKVDFEKEKLIYPQGLISESPTTSNFSQNENFVVFECVHKLLETGYKAEDLVLEKTWKLGHSGKSGRADITIYKGEEVYCIIECKTMGREFDNAKKDLFNNSEGNQLFSYAAQARSVKWLCLYASDYKNEKIISSEEIVKFRDDENILNLSLSDNSIQTFQKASGASDFFRVWEETYNKKTYENLVFKSKAYDIGILPLYKKDLKEFEKGDGLNVKFKEILRHNNISDPQNAFNSLLALFLCKCVDETSKRDDEELDFYYNPFKDNYFSLYKRLLELFIKGMRDFLNEDVYHIENNFVANALQSYIGKNRKKLQGILEEELQKAQIYSAQFFNFKQSYNKKLFEKNGKVLAEVIQLFEKYRFSYSSKYQFLGELFEQFLNEGFKEDEGRYFTPTPISRFMWNSLPFEDFINLEDRKFPKIIDFACGAGHFLTEGISALSDYCKNKISIDDDEISKNFYGIDKDDRLARTSQVAMLLNGAGKTKIRFIDGLEYDREFYGDSQQIFDILIANPPYSVKDFKQHLSQNILKGKDGNIPYEVLELTSLNSAMIENIFVERLTHILKPKGIAAIILPSSILSNTDQATIKAREIILCNFNIHSICSFGNQTFGTTGTNTIILFLSRFDEPPKKIDILQDSIDAIFDLEMQENFVDEEILEAYLDSIEIKKEDYLNLIKKKILPNYALFKEYKNAFENLSEIKKYKKSKAFLALDSKQKEKEITKKLFEYILEIEKEKLKFFSLIYKQKTLIIKAPDKTDEQKKFLGYTISKSKNTKSGLSEWGGGALSSLENRNAQDKIAYAIKQSFKGEFHNHENFSKYVAYVKTCNLLNFSNVEFNKTISLNVDSNDSPFADSKYERVKLGEVCEVIDYVSNGSFESLKANVKSSNNKDYAILVRLKDYSNGWNGNYLYTDKKGFDFLNKSSLKVNDIVMCNVGSVGICFKVPDLGQPMTLASNSILIRSIANKLNNNFMFYFFKSETFQILIKSITISLAQPKFNKTSFRNLQIPLPPLEIQKRIVEECEEVETKKSKIDNLIKAYEELIQASLAKAGLTKSNHNLQNIFQNIRNLDSNNEVENLLDSISTPKNEYERVKIKQICEIGRGRIINHEYINKNKGEYPIYSSQTKNEGIMGYIDTFDFDGEYVTWTTDGIYAGTCFYRKGKFNCTNVCGVLKIKNINEIIYYYLSLALNLVTSNYVVKSANPKLMNNVMAEIQIPLPPLEIQEKIVEVIEKIENKKKSLLDSKQGIEGKIQNILEKYLF